MLPMNFEVTLGAVGVTHIVINVYEFTEIQSAHSQFLHTISLDVLHNIRDISGIIHI